jgi:hypothetical protein
MLCSNGDVRWPLLVAVACAAAPARADVQVHAANGRVDVRATAAPLSDVLDRLAKATGMKVTYDGAPQRVPVTLALTGQTPAGAVLSVLDGLGLNYALRMDLTGTRVETLMIAGTTSASPGGTSAAPPISRAAASYRPPEPQAEAEDEPEAEEEQEAEAPGEPLPPSQEAEQALARTLKATGVPIPPGLPGGPAPDAPAAAPPVTVSPFLVQPPAGGGGQPAPGPAEQPPSEDEEQASR